MPIANGVGPISEDAQLWESVHDILFCRGSFVQGDLIWGELHHWIKCGGR